MLHSVADDGDVVVVVVVAVLLSINIGSSAL